MTDESVFLDNYFNMKGINQMRVVICLGVMVVTFLSTSTRAVNLTYACYPNSTLEVKNPGDYTTVFANNSVTICNTTWNQDKTTTYIEDCGMDNIIMIYFSYLGEELYHVIGGTVSNVYSINCHQIPFNGELKTVSVNMGVGIDVLNSSAYSSFPLHSAIYSDYMATTLATEAPIGMPLFWIMESSLNDFSIKPDECWAYGGKTVHENVPKKLLVYGGCAMDESLLTNFISFSNNGHSNARRALVYTFRFYGSEYVTMECRVRVCPYNPDHATTLCDTNCMNGIQKRDDVIHNYGLEEIRVRSHFRVIDTTSDAAGLDAAFVWLVFVAIVLQRCCTSTK